MSERIRVFVIDDHTNVRQALKTQLSAAPDVQVVGEAGDAEDAINQIRKHPAEVALVESKRADGRGLELISWLAQSQHVRLVLVLTSYPSEWERWAAHRAGAARYLLKDIGSPQLIAQIRRAMAELPSPLPAPANSA
jgi:two-component system response regulator DevR